MDKSLLKYELGEFLEKAKDKTSIPGGGAICALSGSMAASLAIMVYELSRDKIEGVIIEKKIKEVEKSFLILRDNIDRDGSAFDRALKAFKLPKDTEEEREYRSLEIQEGYIEAIKVPLSTMEESVNLVKILRELALEASLHVLTDVDIAAGLIGSSVKGASITIDLNLKSIKNPQLKDYFVMSKEKCLIEVLNKEKEIKEIINKRINCG